MTTITRPPATQPPVLDLDLDTRLALVDAAMAVRLDQAAVAFEVNTAHLPAGDPVPHITAAPIPPPANPYSTPVARLLHDARIRLETDGWCAGSMRGEGRQVCLYGAIRAAAAGTGPVDGVMAVLLEVIRRDLPHVVSVPDWNDRHGTAPAAARYLDLAAHLAHTRNQ
ncbi:hypothetical protein ACIQPQ_31315 [Streptomyces sp. NPDC091281]|uniref:DUF6197 family protein n=1 Tax=Streptomyces sp. NPDC091281 TaxID=3365985 RepID=UPI00382F36DB